MSASYPLTMASAQKLARTLQQLIARTGKATSERLEVATIIDVSNHLSLQYVVGTIGKGPIHIYGAPLGTLVVGMKVYVRTVVEHNVLRAHYVSQASGVQWGYTSGGLQVSSLYTAGAADCTSPNIPAPSLSSAGYYWSFFLYIPQLPASTMCLFDMSFSDGHTDILCLYTPAGQLSLTQGLNGYATTQVAPHNLYHLVWQLGPSTNWSPLLINGSSTGVSSGALADPDTPLNSHVVTSPYNGGGDITFTLAGGTTLQMSLFSTLAGQNPCILGTYLSKISLGYASANSVPFAPVTALPQSDDALPLGFAAPGQGVDTLVQLLCADSVGNTTNVLDSSGNNYHFSYTGAIALTSTGPY